MGSDSLEYTRSVPSSPALSHLSKQRSIQNKISMNPIENVSLINIIKKTSFILIISLISICFYIKVGEINCLEKARMLFSTGKVILQDRRL